MLDRRLLAPQFRAMTLAARARLSWIPFFLWVAFSVFWLIDRLRTKPPEGPFEWAISLVIYGGAFAAGLYGTVRGVRHWARRARTEGPDLDLPMTWHKRSGSWAVIAMAAAMILIFGGLSLIAART
ncbi:hypothetical protein [Caulobacter hibisci]|uniref:Uncharacterized protein n=1 Tax=Caulobacter hibisci TaxID=2035993 RepID=A0ABS0SXJ3_9CAUL|nr:hypothetical protein [Caulobacter hibisci]MBI1683956.1 hypothetical protein [Caulobacter hibisci]